MKKHKVGDKIRGATVEGVGLNGRLIAVYNQWGMGDKGRIMLDGKVVGYCADHPRLMSEFFKMKNKYEEMEEKIHDHHS